MIYAIEAVKDEARGFLESNTFRRPVRTDEKFKALVMVEDPAAVHVAKLVEAAGYKLSSGGEGKIMRCIGTALELYRTTPEIFDRCWPLILEVAAEAQIVERVMGTIVYIESRIAPETLTKAPWRERCIRLGTKGFQEATMRAAAMYSRGGRGIWSKGVLAALNKSVRNQLVMEGDDGNA